MQYFKYLAEELITELKVQLQQANPGHCMRLSGLPLELLRTVCQALQGIKGTQVVLLANQPRADYEISATKLVELRNAAENSHALLVFIPSSLRTGAEDSFDRATFSNLTIDHLPKRVLSSLEDDLDTKAQGIYQKIMRFFLYSKRTPGDSLLAQYLLACRADDYAEEAWGQYLDILGLLPDQALVKAGEQMEQRLFQNHKAIGILSDENTPLIQRIYNLEIEANSLQTQIFEFLSQQYTPENISSWASLLRTEMPALNLAHWGFTSMRSIEELQVDVEPLKGKYVKRDATGKVVSTKKDKEVKVSLNFRTTPGPAEVSSLTQFRIELMRTNEEGNPERVDTLVQFKKTTGRGNQRNKQLTLDPSRLAEGIYYFRVFALDEAGTILNRKDPFQNEELQAEWEQRQKAELEKPHRDDLKGKLSSDSEDFYFSIEDSDEELDEEIDDTFSRRTKAENFTQAKIRAHLDYINKKNLKDLTSLQLDSSSWRDQGKGAKKHCDADIVFNDARHQYMVPTARTLRDISWELLRSQSLNHVRVDFSTAVTELKGQPMLVPCELDATEFKSFIEARKNLFQAILNGAVSEDRVPQGTLELFDFESHQDLVLQYIISYVQSLQNLLEQAQHTTQEEALEAIRQFLWLDMIEMTVPMLSGKKKTLFILPPVHPLRLAWSLQINQVFSHWEKLSLEESKPQELWTEELRGIFMGDLQSGFHPLVLPGKVFKSLVYIGEVTTGWGLYAPISKDSEQTPSQSLLTQVRKKLELPSGNESNQDVPVELVVRQIKRYLQGHPYIECLHLNFFNPGNGQKIVECLKRLQKDSQLSALRYEIRLISSDSLNNDTGQALADFLNPSGYISEESEAFIRTVPNALFPKIRYSLNTLSYYQTHPEEFSAHMSFVFDSFPVSVRLVKQEQFHSPSLFLHGLICKPVRRTYLENSHDFQWDLAVNPNNTELLYKEDQLSPLMPKMLGHIQQMVAILLAGKWTQSLPALSLQVSDKDHALLHTVHQYSDWVMTLDRNLGIEMYDSPADPEAIPYLLDFKPEIKPGYPSVFLTTRPSAEISSIVKPSFIQMGWEEEIQYIPSFLEILRSISGSLIMQLAGGGNKGLETIGLGLSRLLLEELKLLEEYILIPLDLHQDLFAIAQKNAEEERSRQRGDLLLVSCEKDKPILHMCVLEIKCRGLLNDKSLTDLQTKVQEQLTETVTCLQYHFDPHLRIPDRLDRSLKNQQLYEILSFYLSRAHRYHLVEHTYNALRNLIRNLDQGFEIRFHTQGMIFEYGAEFEQMKTYQPAHGVQIFHVGLPIIQHLLKNMKNQRDSKTLPPASLDPMRDTMTLRPEKYKTTFRPDPKTVLPLASLIQKMPESQEQTPLVEISESQLESKPLERPTEADGIHVPVDSETLMPAANEASAPEYTDILGETADTPQYGLLAQTTQGRKIAVDLNGCNTISLFGVPGSGKSYTLGTLVEMATQAIPHVNLLPSPLASVIFHYHESQDYPPEFLTMRFPNQEASQLERLQLVYGAVPQALEDIVLLVPEDKLEERQAEYPDVMVAPIAFSSQELNIKDWKFLMGALGNQAMYMQTLNMIMRRGRNNLTLEFLKEGIENSSLSAHLKEFALHRLELAGQFIDDSTNLRQYLRPGRLVLVDLRDEFIEKEQALGLFVVMLNIFAGAKNPDGSLFNKMIVFDEAHKYITHSELTSHVVEVIRQMRHQGVTMLLASQDPPSLPTEVIELSSAVVLHRFNSPQWLKHVQKTNTSLQNLTTDQLAGLQAGEAFLWANKASNPEWTRKAIKVITRPRVTQHGGSTQKAVNN